MKNDIALLFDEANNAFRAGLFEDAARYYEQLLVCDQNNLRALHGLMVLAYQRHDVMSVVKYFLSILEIDSGYSVAWFSLAKIQKSLGLFSAARLSCMKAFSFGDTSVDLLCVQAAISCDLNLFDEAEGFLNQVVKLDTSCSLAHFEFGRLYQKKRQYDLALKSFAKVLELKPDHAEAYSQQSLIFYMLGMIPEGNKALRRCVEIAPEFTAARSQLAFSLHYEPCVTPVDVLTISRDWAKIVKAKNESETLEYTNVPAPERVIRIGFVSPDFRRHPVGYFVQPFLMLHDPDSFEVFCYSDVRVGDEITQNIIDAVDNWRVIYGVNDDKVLELIRHDKIDILVDLAGHTKDNRLNLFAAKPAPVQVTWAGYVGTTGLDTIDYLISDRFQSPEGAEEYSVEQIVRMPNDYICFMPPDYAPEVSPLPAFENGFITFGSFNNLAKLSDATITLWTAILKRLPEARLFVKNPSFSDEGAVNLFLKKFEAQGISVNRITTEGQSTPEEMLARYACIDIHLDSLPYSGGLTTLESLWMGVPVVTLPGALFSSRHSLTHLMNVGLSCCVASSQEDYIAIACNLASDVKNLVQLRSGLRGMMADSPVCDGFGFTEHLQKAFRKMWCGWCETALPCAQEHCLDNESSVLGDHIACNEQGNQYSEEGDYESAIKCYKQALDIKPGYIEAYYNMGIVYRKMQCFEDAVKMLQVAAWIAPDFVEVYQELSDSLRLLGKNEDALLTDARANEMTSMLHAQGVLR